MCVLNRNQTFVCLVCVCALSVSVQGLPADLAASQGTSVVVTNQAVQVIKGGSIVCTEYESTAKCDWPHVSFFGFVVCVRVCVCVQEQA